MKAILCVVLVPLFAIVACNSPTPETSETIPEFSSETTAKKTSMADHALGLNNEIDLSETIRNAWSGAKIQVTENATGETWRFDVDLGDTLSLGETELMLEAKVFIPDFTMDEGGISSSSAEAKNPALQVVITDASGETYEGWLFALMPEIHAYQHPEYSVILLEGITKQE